MERQQVTKGQRYRLLYLFCVPMYPKSSVKKLGSEH
nr:MAG TPA: hypothetical protein [Caudoviricetes sp.]